jgi:molybdopterin/thiamine biosynthesis adenylyltransferase
MNQPRSIPDIYGRLRELLDVQFMLGMTIGIIGLGRAGAFTFYHLLRYPIRRIKLVDFDMVSERDTGNLFPFSMMGKHKVVALKEFAALWNPFISVEYESMKITKEKLSQLIHWLGDCDLLFIAMDDVPLIEDLCIAFYPTKRIVGSVATQQGAFGIIGWSAPGQTSCIDCALGVSQASQGRGRPSLPSDFDVIQNYAVQLGLGLLLVGKKGYELFSNLIHPDYNLLLVYNRENGNNVSRTPEIPKGVQLLRVKSSCPICRRRG